MKDPAERLGGGKADAIEVMVHPFFESISWERLIRKYVPFSRRDLWVQRVLSVECLHFRKLWFACPSVLDSSKSLTR